MKKTLLLLAFSTLLFAAVSFWQQLIEIEQRFYSAEALRPIGVKKKPEPPKTADANATVPKERLLESALESSTEIDEKFKAFKTLLTALKLQPYTVQDPQNPFFHPARAQEELFKLATKVRINRDNGYMLAVERDRIAIKTLKLKQQIYVFFASLAVKWTDIETETLKSDIKKEYEKLKTYKLAELEKKYAELDPGNPIAEALRKNLVELRMHYYFYKDILSYMMLNPGILHYESLLQRLELGQIITAINRTDAAIEVNNVLRYVKLDLGRLVLFIAVMVGAGILALLFYFKAYELFRYLITREEDEYDDLLLANLDNVRRPILILILTAGLELGLEALRYPNPPENGGILFYFIYLMTISFIIVTLIDNFVFHFLLKRAKATNREMRQELVNLVISIIKIIVFLIAGLLFLVRLGVNITGLIASLGIGGLAVALAAKDTLSNFFGLLKILTDNSFSQGDWIEADDIEGTVVEIGFISTDIRTFDNALITVPNEKLANAALKNWNRRSVGRRIKMHIGVTYGSDREKLMDAIDAIRKMLHEHPGIASPDKFDPRAFRNRYKRERKLVSTADKYGIKTTLLVYLDELADSSMNILIYAFSSSTVWEEWLAVKEDVIFKIWEILEAHDLEFAFPSQSLYFDRDNLESTVAPVLENRKPAAE